MSIPIYNEEGHGNEEEGMSKKARKRRPKYVYETIDEKEKVLSKLMLMNPPPEPGSDLDLRVGQVGPWTDKANIRRIK